MNQRTQRVDELIRQEIGVIISREVSDPRIGFVTITDVTTTPDLSHATVSVSFIGSPEERTASLRALSHAMPFIRRELGRRLTLRRIPELHVEADVTIERGTRVLKLINELALGNDAPEASVDQDTLPTPVPRLPHEGDAPLPPLVVPPAPGPAGARKSGQRSGARSRPAGASARHRDPGSRRKAP
ncbi:MAG: 30S ribosome-binding factor RbfA [Chloroflexota bacterium]